jgi:hypothetical protein
MAAQTIGYAVITRTELWQAIDPQYLSVWAVTSITARRVYVRSTSVGRQTSSFDIAGLMIFRKTKDEADEWLKMLLDRTRAQREDLAEKRKAYEIASEILQKQLRASFEPKPEPRRALAQQISKLSTDELEAELKKRKGTQ